MHTFRTRFLVPSLALLLLALPAAAQRGGRGGRGGGGGVGGGGTSPAAMVNALPARLVGPLGLLSGRVYTLAVDPAEPSHYFVGVASGGVWKTDNDGTTMTPVFDREGSYSIGALALQPGNPNVLWVGTGEANAQRTVSYGDGVYKSEDGGRTFRNTGLRNSEHIGRIVIDPRHPDTVYVAAQGPVWSAGGDRGVYKTVDGGQTWTQSLKISDHTGVADIVMDPRDSNVLYASAWMRERHVYTLIDGGPESALYKTTDGGATWTKLRLLPGTDLGRIGLAISPVDPNIIYAVVEAQRGSGGIFVSTDGGATWERRNAMAPPDPMYYGQIVADPKYADRVYVLGTNNMVSDDGGRTFTELGGAGKHVDNHVLWIDPNDNNHYLGGCDGGLYESWDRAATWEWKTTLPTGQFIHIATDNAAPFYNIYGGTQDNSSEGGPTHSYVADGILPGSWVFTGGGDGFVSAIDPVDSDIVYSESQGGAMERNNLRTHEDVNIQPVNAPGTPALRWDWDTPFTISPWDHNRVYFGAQYVFRSDDQGSSWKQISPDLTRNIDRDTLPVFGRVWGPNAVGKNDGTGIYGTLTTIDESPKKQGLLYVGTDDGLIQVSADAGAHWTKVDGIPGVPNDRPFVAKVLASLSDPDTVYAAFDDHKNGDYKPYLFKSTDEGKTWTSISNNLPEKGTVYAIAQDGVDPNLLFVGTEYGLFISLDGGAQWNQYRNLPVIKVDDIAIQRRENDLVIATMGRDVYIIDDYSPLRSLDAPVLQADGAILPVRPALEYEQAHPIERSSLGSNYPVRDNPPYGALITYFIKSVPITDAQRQAQLERQTEQSGTDFTWPTPEQQRALAADQPATFELEIADASGHTIRSLPVGGGAGLHRTNWDLRLPAPAGGGRGGAALPVIAPPAGGRGGGGGGGGGGRGGAAAAPPAGGGGGFGGGGGALVLPGTYQVKLVEHYQDKWTTLAGPTPITVVADKTMPPPADRQAYEDFQAKLVKLRAAATIVQQTLAQVQVRVALIQQSVAVDPAGYAALVDQTDQLNRRLTTVQQTLATEVNARAQRAGSNESRSMSKPTQTSLDEYTWASAALAKAIPTARAIVETDLPSLEKAVTAAGLTLPGTMPTWTASGLPSAGH